VVTALHGSLGLVGAPLLLLCATAADGRGRPVVAHLLRAVAMAAAAVAALGVIGHGQLQAPLGAWLELGRLQLVVGLHADSLGALALGAVTVQAFVFPFSCPAADGGERGLLTLSAVGVALVAVGDGWFALLLGWEVATAAVLLLAARSVRLDPVAARRILLLTRIGTLGLVAGALISLSDGDATSGFLEVAGNAKVAWLVTATAFLGLGAWPAHIWHVDASPSPVGRMSTGIVAVAALYLLLRVTTPGLLADVLVVAGLAAALLAASASLSSLRTHRIPALAAAAHAGLVVWAAASEPAAAQLLLAAALCSGIATLAGFCLLDRALPSPADRHDVIGGLAAALPATRWVCLAGGLIPCLSGATLWGQAVMLQHWSARYGVAGLAVVLVVVTCLALPLLRFVLTPFAGAPRQTTLRDTKAQSTLAPVLAAAAAAAVAFVAVPALAWKLLPMPSAQALGMVAAANLVAAGAAAWIWRQGLEARTAPLHPLRRLAAHGYGVDRGLVGVSAAAAVMTRTLWTAVDTAAVGGAWASTNLVLRGGGWLLARIHLDRRPLWAVALGAGVAAVALWSLGG
jgi:hypothetical protein